jgi:hypothetical protein
MTEMNGGQEGQGPLWAVAPLMMMMMMNATFTDCYYCRKAVGEGFISR